MLNLNQYKHFSFLGMVLAFSVITLSSYATPVVVGQIENDDILIALQKFDAKTYPGITCETQDVGQIGDFENYFFGMYNTTNGRKSVVCPVVRDNTRNLNGTYSAYVHVYNPANRSFDCTLYSLDDRSGYVDSYSNSTSLSGYQTIYLDVDASVAGGYYGIVCEMANGGSIQSYEVREFLSTDEESVPVFQFP